MPTEKPRITFTVNPETLSKIDDYRYSHKMKNQTQAILSLLERGLSSLSQSASTVKAETAIPEDDGSLESDEFLKTYARLSPAKQSLVQSLVRELSSAEERADDSQD